MTSPRRRPRAAPPLWAALGLLLVATLPAAAQPALDVQASGTNFFVYAEPGAPTINVMVIGETTKNGLYRLQEGTTLTELLALGGGTPGSSETERRIVQAAVRVLRESDGTRVAVYEATTEQAIREPRAHPQLEDGDVVELDVTYEDLGEPFTLLRGLEIASRLASLTTVVLLLLTGSRSL